MLAFFLSILGIGRSIGTAVITWLSKRSLAELASLALVIVCLILFLSLSAEKRHSAKLQTQLVTCTNLRTSDRAAYAKAQADAQSKNIADVQRDKQRKQEISDETVARLNADLAELRKRVSHGGTPAPQSHSGKPGLSPGDKPAGGADGQAGVCLSSAELLRAAENEERHDRLIDYVEGLSKIDPNTGDAK